MRHFREESGNAGITGRDNHTGGAKQVRRGISLPAAT